MHQEDITTPMMQQYAKLKQQNKDKILLFRLGDFYEAFFEDAKIISSVLNITLTSRNVAKERRVPMAGVPYHAANNYIRKLINEGYKVAICEQVEEKTKDKRLLAREVVRIITPGVLLEEHLLQDDENNYVAALYYEEKIGYGVAWLDSSTGDFKLTQISREDKLLCELARIKPKEYIIPASFEDFFNKLLNNITFSKLEDWVFEYSAAYNRLIDHFKIITLDTFGIEGYKLGIIAAGAILYYIKETQPAANLSTISSIKLHLDDEYMSLDSACLQNLNILSNDNSPDLYSILNRTKTPMGSRLLKNWLLYPLAKKEKINYRQEAIEELYKANMSDRQKISFILKKIKDIERLLARIDADCATPADLLRLKDSLLAIPELKETIRKFKTKFLTNIEQNLYPCEELCTLIEEAIPEQVPHNYKEEIGIIKRGYCAELDQLYELVTNAKEYIIKLQEEEIRRSKIPSLKVGYNKIFGYYIEVSKANADKVPPNYIKKQTLTHAERFITPELKEKEALILSANDKIKELELNIFSSIKQKILKQSKCIKITAEKVAELDVVLSLAEVARSNNYTKPKITDDLIIEIIEGRHPVLEKIIQDVPFVPNDTFLSSRHNQIMIITGPNMAGKSTYIRQVALIVLLAQMGAYVPAKAATIGIADKILTRIGFADELTRKRSTFMVEMQDVANILNNITERSLVILDEVGRGTSTFDGISIAWAVVEFLHNNNKGYWPRTLFATHYHELAELEGILKRVKNYNIMVKETQNRLIFLHKIAEGATDKSYGIHVAQLAGLPKSVIDRAKYMLEYLKKEAPFKKPQQINLFSLEEEKNNNDKKSLIIEELKNLDLNNLTPMEALNKLFELKNKINENE